MNKKPPSSLGWLEISINQEAYSLFRQALRPIYKDISNIINLIGKFHCDFSFLHTDPFVSLSDSNDPSSQVIKDPPNLYSPTGFPPTKTDTVSLPPEKKSEQNHSIPPKGKAGRTIFQEKTIPASTLGEKGTINELDKNPKERLLLSPSLSDHDNANPSNKQQVPLQTEYDTSPAISQSKANKLHTLIQSAHNVCTSKEKRTSKQNDEFGSAKRIKKREKLEEKRSGLPPNSPSLLTKKQSSVGLAQKNIRSIFTLKEEKQGKQQLPAKVGIQSNSEKVCVPCFPLKKEEKAPIPEIREKNLKDKQAPLQTSLSMVPHSRTLSLRDRNSEKDGPNPGESSLPQLQKQETSRDEDTAGSGGGQDSSGILDSIQNSGSQDRGVGNSGNSYNTWLTTLYDTLNQKLSKKTFRHQNIIKKSEVELTKQKKSLPDSSRKTSYMNSKAKKQGISEDLQNRQGNQTTILAEGPTVDPIRKASITIPGLTRVPTVDPVRKASSSLSGERRFNDKGILDRSVYSTLDQLTSEILGSKLGSKPSSMIYSKTQTTESCASTLSTNQALKSNKIHGIPHFDQHLPSDITLPEIQNINKVKKNPQTLPTPVSTKTSESSVNSVIDIVNETLMKQARLHGVDI